MTVHVISQWHNEAFLAPLFLRHYDWADRITIIADDCTDGCDDEAHRAGADIIEHRTGGMDDLMKADVLTKVAKASPHDWAVVVDADEFVRPFHNVVDNLLRVAFATVYRHETDADIDRTRRPWDQRRHGTPPGTCYGQHHFVKPCIVRPSELLRLGVGCHTADCQPTSAPWYAALPGSHWCMADPCFCVDRRIRGRKDRMSQTNFTNGLTSQHWHVTEQEILDECAAHRLDPLVLQEEAN